MGRFTKLINRLSPRTGRLITERGSTVNEADYLERAGSGVDAFGQTATVEYTAQIEEKPGPEFSVLRNRVVPEGGNVTASPSGLVVDGTSQKVTDYTLDRGRYIPGLLLLAGLGYEFSDPDNGIYEIGYGDDLGNRIGLRCENGVYRTFVETNNDRYYNQPRIKWVDRLDGTGPSGINYDLRRATLRMVLGWYGTIPPEFYIVVNDRQRGARSILIDRAELPPTGFVINQPDLPVFAEADGGVLTVGGRQAGVLGRYVTQTRVTGAFASKSVGTSFEPIVSFEHKGADRWAGVPVRLAGASVLSDVNAEFAVIIDGTLTNSNFGSVPFISDGETALRVDTAADTIEDGEMLYPDNVSGGQGNTSGGTPVEFPDLPIPAGAIVTLVGRGIDGPAGMEVTFRLREER